MEQPPLAKCMTGNITLRIRKSEISLDTGHPSNKMLLLIARLL